MKKTSQYVVFGFHADTGQRFTTSTTATSHAAAEKRVLKECDGPELTIVASIRGYIDDVAILDRSAKIRTR